MAILISYPYSGSMWLRYIIETISKKPTLGVFPSNLSVGQQYPIGVDLKAKPILIKRNRPESQDKNEKHIFLIRNYGDVFIQQAWDTKDDCTVETVKEVFDKDYIRYLGILEEYKKSETEKILVYYEDIMQEPEIWITKILEFIGLAPGDFFNNYEQHFRCSLGIYRRRHKNDDKDKIDISSIQKEMSNVLMYSEPFLYSEFLVRYDE